MLKIKEVVSYEVAGKFFNTEQEAKDYVAFQLYEERVTRIKIEATECYILNPHMRISTCDLGQEQLQRALKILRELEALYVELYGSSLC